MPLWVKRTSWFVAVIVAAAFGHWLATQVATRNAKPIEQSTKASLPIEARSTDFGEVLEDSDFAWTVQLRNLGTEAIEVTRVITSCDDCLQATPQAFELPGGGEFLSISKSI